MIDEKLEELAQMKKRLYQISGELGGQLRYEGNEWTLSQQKLAVVQLHSVVGCLISVLDLAEELK